MYSFNNIFTKCLSECAIIQCIFIALRGGKPAIFPISEFNTGLVLRIRVARVNPTQPSGLDWVGLDFLKILFGWVGLDSQKKYIEMGWVRPCGKIIGLSWVGLDLTKKLLGQIGLSRESGLDWVEFFQSSCNSGSNFILLSQIFCENALK